MKDWYKTCTLGAVAAGSFWAAAEAYYGDGSIIQAAAWLAVAFIAQTVLVLTADRWINLLWHVRQTKALQGEGGEA
jgi:hypothetical protein